jgi:hypothetical protein
MKNGGKLPPCCCTAKALDNQSYRSNHYAMPGKQIRTIAPLYGPRPAYRRTCLRKDLLTEGGFDR